MNAAALLAELETVGIQITREEHTLRVRGNPGANPALYRERIREHKSALLALLGLQDEIVRTASAAQGAFDRRRYDEVWVAWHALQQESM
jgi:hypothetical protein